MMQVMVNFCWYVEACVWFLCAEVATGSSSAWAADILQLLGAPEDHSGTSNLILSGLLSEFICCVQQKGVSNKDSTKAPGINNLAT